MNKPLQVRAPLCLSEGLELGKQLLQGLCSRTGDKASRRNQGGILFHRQNSPVELAALRYQNHRAKEASKEKLKRRKGVWVRRMSLPTRGPLEKQHPGCHQHRAPRGVPPSQQQGPSQGPAGPVPCSAREPSPTASTGGSSCQRMNTQPHQGAVFSQPSRCSKNPH